MSATIAELREYTGRRGHLLSIQADSTAAQAAQVMSTHDIGCLIVFDANNQFVGILSERDMITKVYAENLKPDAVIIKDIMTSSVVSCSLNTPIAEAERLMDKHRIRHLPILDGGQPVDMISSRDTAGYRLKNSKAMQMAAEELAMLPTGLKSLDFEDVVSMAINEVPKHLGAERATLCFVEDDSNQLNTFQNGCRCEKSELLRNLDVSNESSSPQIITSHICSGCNDSHQQRGGFVIPLSIQDHCSEADEKNISGFLCMCQTGNAETVDQTHVYKATILQQVLSSNLTNARLYRSYEDARRDSEIDPLTGVGTRRILENVLRAECARALRYGCTFSIAIVDLDNFKTINDTAGHAAGDRKLKELADLMREQTRNTDTVITRYGGDEFVLILPETKLSGAKIVLDRICQQFNHLSLPGIGNLSISAGVVEWSSEPADTAETIMQRADAALYEAKEGGRNRVVSHMGNAILS